MSDPQVKDSLDQVLGKIFDEESRLPLLVKPHDERRHAHRMTWTETGNVLDQALQAMLLTADDAAGITRSLKRFSGLRPESQQALGRVMNMLFVARAAACGRVDRSQRSFYGLTRAQLLERYGYMLHEPKRRSRRRGGYRSAVQRRSFAS
ncbi:MAG: hypothetical protein HY975_04480 [Candidatus Kerfeldbacteria bacterium]|nr:hypothetical protein [Candidatus Kerfeldbacteria bacterium]